MKIYCNIDQDKRKYEGRTFLAGQVTNFLKEKGYQFTKNPEEADLLHFHSSGILDSYRSYKLKKKYNVPCIFSFYSNSKTELFRHPLNFLAQRYYFTKPGTGFLLSYTSVLPLSWREHFLKKLDRVIVPSNYLKNKLSDNAQIIRFGVDNDKFSPKNKGNNKHSNNQSSKQSDDDNKKVKVAYFGHPGVFKGMNDFVNASKKFDKSIEIHVFPSRRSEKIDDFIFSRNNKIIVHDFAENIAERYNEMDIIVLPYRMKIGTVANPLVLLEAMSCGKPIITTNYRFIREIVGDTALIVKPYSPNKIAKAVNYLIKNKELREAKGKKARERALERFNQNIMFNDYLKLYQEFEDKISKNHKNKITQNNTQNQL